MTPALPTCRVQLRLERFESPLEHCQIWISWLAGSVKYVILFFMHATIKNRYMSCYCLPAIWQNCGSYFMYRSYTNAKIIISWSQLHFTDYAITSGKYENTLTHHTTHTHTWIYIIFQQRNDTSRRETMSAHQHCLSAVPIIIID